MANFFHELKSLWDKLSGVYPELPESAFGAIPARPATSELAEDLLVDPEALKLETHEPGVFDENGEYVPQYSDDPKDLDMFSPTSLDSPALSAESEDSVSSTGESNDASPET